MQKITITDIERFSRNWRWAGIVLCALSMSETARAQTIQNEFVSVEYDQASSNLRIIDRRGHAVGAQELTWWIASPAKGKVHAELAPGTNQLRLLRQRQDGLDESLFVGLGNGPAVELAFGLTNHGTNDLRIQTFGLRGAAFPGQDFPEYRTLDGESSGSPTHVSSAPQRESQNNLLATFGLPGHAKHSLVVGGLRYREFTRHCAIAKTAHHLAFEVTAADPYGKLVKAGTSYEFRDTIYLDVVTANRFEALETYGRALAQANEVDLAVPDIPVINLWYAQEKRFGNGPFKDNTAGALWTVEDARKAGFLKYGPIGVRLEPDDYAAPNNQQGWWNDGHFRLYRSGQYVEPYETAAKWGAAMKAAGGVPFIYCQTARRSEDYCQQFPGHLLFNNPAKLRPTTIEWFKDKYWSYDFTDPGFIQHMREVYATLRQAGVRGMKFDYPTTGWNTLGGFEDPLATTSSAYRNIFQLAFDGLGAGREVHERLCAGGDLTLGPVNIMRIQEDTDKLYPPMVAKGGLRWYKNRVTVHYDLDAKNPDHAVPADSIDGVRAMFTMTTVVSSRLELGKYLGEMTPEQRRVVSRVLPLYLGPKSARPLDAFSVKDYPQVYDLEVTPGWHQVTLYNTALEGERWPTDWEKIIHPLEGRPIPATVSVELGRPTDEGGLGLEAGKRYHLFDFWNDHYVGLFHGSDRLTQQLRPGEARMLSVHEALDRPQFLSTDRHVLQGVVDLPRCEWQPLAKKLTGSSRLVAGEPCTIIIASNGYRGKGVSAVAAEATWQPRPEAPQLLALRLVSAIGGTTDWEVAFEKLGL